MAPRLWDAVVAEEIELIGVGDIDTSNGLVPLEPSIFEDTQVGDFLMAVAVSRTQTGGSFSVPTGWEEVIQESSDGAIGVWVIQYTAGLDPPQIFPVGHSLNEKVVAQVATFRGITAENYLDVLGVIENPFGINVGPIPGLTGVHRASMVLAIGMRFGVWSGVNPLSDDDLDFIPVGTGIVANPSGLSFVWNYAIASEDLDVSAQTFQVNSTTEEIGKGILIAFLLDADAFSVSEHLVLYSAAYHPLDDDAQVGGEIDDTIRAVFTDLAAQDDLEVLSDDTEDTDLAITVRGRDANRNLVTQSVLLDGTTPVPFSIMSIIERVISVFKNGESQGTITVRRAGGGATIGTIPPNEVGFRRIFVNAYPSPSAAKLYYEKVFLKNRHPRRPIINTVISESADPSGDITFLLSAAVDDLGAATNRVTAPATDITLPPNTFDGNDKNVPAILEPGSAIGIWLRLSVAAGDSPFKSTYTLGVAGSVVIV